MEINARDGQGITDHSVAEANPFKSCAIFINVQGGGIPIAYHTVIEGEVNYVADIAYMIPPKPWWQPAIDFLTLQIGTLWIEVLGIPFVVIGISIMCIRRLRG